MIYPMFALFLLVLIVFFLAVRARFSAVRSGRMKIKYFRAMNGDQPTVEVILTGRHFMNLFELPVLFYVACLSAIVLNQADAWMIGCAWAFVVFRYVQAFIHLTYNNILHRMIAFCLGVFILTIMWGTLVIRA